MTCGLWNYRKLLTSTSTLAFHVYRPTGTYHILSEKPLSQARLECILFSSIKRTLLVRIIIYQVQIKSEYVPYQQQQPRIHYNLNNLYRELPTLQLLPNQRHVSTVEFNLKPSSPSGHLTGHFNIPLYITVCTNNSSLLN